MPVEGDAQRGRELLRIQLAEEAVHRGLPGATPIRKAQGLQEVGVLAAAPLSHSQAQHRGQRMPDAGLSRRGSGMVANAAAMLPMVTGTVA
jgi:hypothetical protein